MKKLSILIPAYNEERTIHFILNKIEAVSLPYNIEKEIIIVNDCSTDNTKTAIEDFSVVIPYDDIIAKNYSLSAGQYFEVKIEYTEITPVEFATKMKTFESNLSELFAESKVLEIEIQNNLKGLKYE